MKAIKFDEQNTVIAEDQQDTYLAVPAHNVGNKEGTLIMKIELSDEDLKFINENKYFWYSRWTFNQSFQPFSMFTNPAFVKLELLTDLSPEVLVEVIKSGYGIGNTKISSAFNDAIFRINTATERNVSYSIRDPKTGKIMTSLLTTWEILSEKMIALEMPETFFIIYPEQ